MTEEPANQTTLRHDVFVSYASQDAAVANSVVESLEQHGLKCWIAPRDVKPGAQYADAIVRAINDAKALVLILSARATASSHVGREVERAASKRKPIIPFRLENAALNPEFEYFLSNSQWIDVPKLGMPAALAKLKEALGLGAAPSLQAAPPRRVSAAGKRVGAAAAVLVAVGVTGVLGWHFWSSRNAAQPATVAMVDKSIAVLPFTDMSEKKDQEYFGDGMAEEIIDLMVKIPGLRVIARTSSFAFKGKTEDLRSIAKQLGVAYVLEGSVRKSGDHIRVTAQLIDSRDGAHLFSQTYDRDLSDVLKMQDEIAIALVRALQIQVGANDFIARPALRNSEAYALYLQGRHAFDRFDLEGFEQAVSYYQRALDLDPSFAEAAVGLADAYNQLGETEPGYISPAVAFERARNAAKLALKLDPNLASAHAALASVPDVDHWDWAAAERELQLALTLAPDDPQILMAVARQSMILGRWDDALKLVNASIQRDPLNPRNYDFLSEVQLRRGRLAEAEAAQRRVFEISSTSEDAHNSLGLLLLARNEPKAALAEFLKETDPGVRNSGLAMAYFDLGRKADSDAALAQLLENRVFHDSIDVAQVYAYRGQTDAAFKWLDRAYMEKNTLLQYIKSNTRYKNLEGDPRYKAMLKKMNLPE